MKSLGKMILLHFSFILFVGMTTSRKFNEINLVRNYIGCFRNFDESSLCSTETLDIRSCLECCDKEQSTFAGLKNGESCHCGEKFEKSSDESNCRMKCPHSELQNCGGRLDFSVFSVCEIGYHGDRCRKPCNGCLTSVLCSRKDGRCLYDCHDNNHGCDISRLLTDVNIAYKRPVSQSSTHVSGENTSYPPELAVDGNFNNSFANKFKAYCSQTRRDVIPWFHVDLGQSTTRGVVITNRAGGLGSRLAGVEIYILDKLPGYIESIETFNTVGNFCSKRENIGDQNLTVEMNCGKPIKGRHLFAVLPSKNHLTICEIEVFAESCNVTNNCKTNEQCQHFTFNGTVHYRCFCKEGFRRQNLVTECQDIDECKRKINPCGNNSDCTNNIGSYSCRCHDGFKDNHYGLCQDVDECMETSDLCGDNANCTNNIGSYACTCHNGFIKESPGKGCVDINECSERNDSCGNNENCTNTIGSYACRCNRGYQNDSGTGCLDVDECNGTSDYPCGTNTNCMNVDGGYECLCKEGFYGDPNQRCVDKDECNDGTNNCAGNSNCSNSIGSYQCHCNDGFTGDPYQICIDLDECSAENYRCGNNTNCVNELGSFKCHCKDGYQDDPNQGCIATSNPVVAVLVTMAVLLALALFGFLVYFYVSRIRKAEKTVDTEKIVLSENASNKEGKEDTKIKIENLASYMLDVMTKNSSGFAEQFDKIPKIAPYSMSISKASGKGKNRFTNIIPYDYNRVVLKESHKESDYINASHIETGKQKFIAAQGPTNETVGQFWQMIVEQDVSDIVMLTQIMEKSKNKCFQYWPEEYEAKFGKYTVTLESSVDFEDYIRRELRVSLTDTGKNSKTVMQWHYMCWPDHGVPTNVDSFMKFNNVSMRNADMNKAVIVHCSAGVGRTGCFIAIDFLLDEAKREGTIDVVACVSMLREQRSNMVQSAIQYDFIYYALKCTTTKSNTDIPMDMFHSTFMVLNEGNEISDEFHCLKEEAGFLEKRGKTKFKSNQWWISSFMGMTAKNHHHISCYPEENAIADFWNFCFQSKCLLVLVANLKTWEQQIFLPTADKQVITDNFCVFLRDQQVLKFGTLLEICIKSKVEEENIYENKASAGREISVKVLKLRSDHESHISEELFQHAKQKLDVLNQSRRFDNLLVLSPDKSPLASYFVACCDLTEQLSSRKYVDVCRTVLELKRTPVTDSITLDQYKKLYKFTENQVQMLTNVYYNQ